MNHFDSQYSDFFRIIRPKHLFVILLFLIGTSCSQLEEPTAEAESLPNIVMILADDMGMGDVGAYNAASKAPTPSLDSLAASGMRFTDAHSPSAVCTPTRYGLLTGRYSWRTSMKSGVLKGYSPLLIDTSRSTIASMLREKGYATAVIGKWHLGLGEDKVTDYSKPLSPGPNEVGFDYFFGIPASLDMPPYTFVENDRVFTSFDGDEVGDSGRRRDGGEGFWRAGPIARDFAHEDVLPQIMEHSVAFIREQAKSGSGNPFFLYVPLNAPHTPWMPTTEFIGKSEAGYYGDFVVQVDHTVERIIDCRFRGGQRCPLGSRANRQMAAPRKPGLAWPEGRHPRGRAPGADDRLLARSNHARHREWVCHFADGPLRHLRRRNGRENGPDGCHGQRVHPAYAAGRVPGAP
jgi:hypothetical protein